MGISKKTCNKKVKHLDILQEIEKANAYQKAKRI